MTSTPEDGKTVPQNGEQDANGPDVQNEISFEETEDHEQGYFDSTHVEDADELLQFTEETDPEPNVSQQFSEDQDATPVDHPQGLSLAVTQLRVQSPSIDGSASIPDDTPSLQASGVSSPQSDALSLHAPTSRKGATPPRRPFDLRFQSRLSSSTIGSPRASSPAFLASHSRQSSLASFAFQSVSEPDNSTAPWEVIRWTKLNRLSSQVFVEASRRNFGMPTCLAVSDQLVIGTSKGIILVFDHQQNHKAIIGSGTRAVECGAIVSLAISADHTTIAAGHMTGHIFTWEIGRVSRPFLHIPPIDMTVPEARKTDGNLSGSSVLHIGFLGFRRTALVSADDKGMAFSHLASRGTGALGRRVSTTRILGRYPDLVTRGVRLMKKSSVLAFSPLPLGNIERSTDSLGLVAMLTPYLLVVVSTTPIAQTQHKAARPKDVTAHGAMTAALSWFPAIKLKGDDSAVSKSKLAYAWSDVLTVLDIHEVVSADVSDKEKPPELQFLPRNRFKAEEAIVAIQWLSRSVMAVLTITQQLLIIEDMTMVVTDSFDLLPKDILHSDAYSHQLQGVIEDHNEDDNSMHGVVADAYHMSFKSYKGRLFLLGFKGLWWGSLTNWADRLLAMMDADDFIGAIRLATSYYVGSGEKLTIGLPEDDEARAGMVHEKLIGMMTASLRFAFGRNQVVTTEPLDKAQLMDLAVACVAACLSMDDQVFLFDEVFSWYDDFGQGTIFVDVLEPHILDGKVTALPPTALKTLIDHFKTTHSSSKLEEIICLLDPRAMDIDQVTSLCKQNKLYDAYIYVWNTALQDFSGPLDEFLKMAIEKPMANGYTASETNSNDIPHKIFAYISFILTGRVYPTGILMTDDIALTAKSQVYDFLFSGAGDIGSNDTYNGSSQTPVSTPFPRLRAILSYDSSSFMAAMNEAFEDSYLNIGVDDDGDDSPSVTDHQHIYNRRIIVQILLGVMSSGFEEADTIYLDMFIARNLPKYPQYMRLLSGTTLQETFLRLCHNKEEDLQEDKQLSVEYLLSVYRPDDILAFVPVLRKARFYRVLKSVFRQENRYAELVELFFDDPDDKSRVFEVIIECLQEGSSLTTAQREQVLHVVEDHAFDLTSIDVDCAASMVDTVCPHMHSHFVSVQNSNPSIQYRYLRTLIEPELPSRAVSEHVAIPLLESYVRLMCQYQPSHVVDYIKSVKEEDLKLEEVMPAMERSGAIDAAVILLARQGKVGEAMDRLVKHVGVLQAALRGLLDNAEASPDAVGTNEAIEDVLESIERYTGVGVWICQGHSNTVSRSKPPGKLSRKSSAVTPLSFDETLWLDLLSAIVAIAQDVTPRSKANPEDTEDQVQSSVRNAIQNAFTALLTTTTASREGARAGSDFTFLRIMRAFLTRAAESSPSLSALRNVIASIFSAYSYEASLLALSNSMLDKDLFIHVDEIAKLRQQGWRPRGQVCEICRRRIWGPGIGLSTWEAWERDEQQRKARRSLGPSSSFSPAEEMDMSRGKGKAAAIAPAASGDDERVGGTSLSPKEDEEGMPGGSGGQLVVFSCRHLYHKRCLMQSQGQSDGQQQLNGGVGQEQEAFKLRCPSCP